MKFAVMGASGFVGSRLLEIFYLNRQIQVRPIVRGYGSLSRLARFDLDWRIADAADEDALTAAFEGCDVVVHSVHGSPAIIEHSLGPAYRAACKAKIKRIVYLSTASVHGQAPAPATDETSILSDRQRTDYNNLKVRAERLLLRERARGDTEVVILRPGIVFGPRDRWVTGIANDLMKGTAYLVEGGLGICNSIYVDNLVHAIELASVASNVDGEAFLVGDQETVTWSDFVCQVAFQIGVPNHTIHKLSAPESRVKVLDKLHRLRGHPATQRVLPFLPARLKRVVKASISAWPSPQSESPWTIPVVPAPQVSKEMSELHQCKVKLPWSKAHRIFGYQPVISFHEGLVRTVDWLRWAGLVNDMNIN